VVRGTFLLECETGAHGNIDGGVGRMMMMMRLVLVTKVLFVSLFRIWVISLVNYMNQIAERLRYDRSLDSYHNAGEVKQHSVLSSVTAVQIFRFKSVKVQVSCSFSPKDAVKCWILSA
jgi:hypothetical protein